jgi:1,4-dihydroxy-6-naphthoate synthase
MRTLTLGYSPCPNDTFIFHALTHGTIPTPGLAFDVRHEDVETLNRMALAGALDITKVSYGAIMSLMDRYCLLRSGGALGRGCGPLVVGREGMDLNKLRGKRIAVPGLMTTAYLLMSLYDPELLRNATPMRFDKIMPAVAAGEFDAGLVIHEGRFTYQAHGLVQLMDLDSGGSKLQGSPYLLGAYS